MIHNQINHHAQSKGMRLVDECDKIAQRAEPRIDTEVIRNVIAAIAKRRRMEGKQPDGCKAKTGNIRELLGQSAEIADAVAVAILERFDFNAINDSIFVPIISQSDCTPAKALSTASFSLLHGY